MDRHRFGYVTDMEIFGGEVPWVRGLATPMAAAVQK